MIPYLRDSEIEEKAYATLIEHQTLGTPVPVKVLAYRLGLSVEEVPLGDEVSGLLVIKNSKGFIGVNADHADARKRFTIAHEIGHYILHYLDRASSPEIFIDKKYNRNNASSKGEVREEIQANLFAAALLMPRKLLEDSIEIRSLDLGDDLTLANLSQDFEVSVQALTLRLTKLDIFDFFDAPDPN